MGTLRGAKILPTAAGSHRFVGWVNPLQRAMHCPSTATKSRASETAHAYSLIT